MKKQFIFNIGLSNSGTTSLTEALNILGIPSVHFIHNGQELETIMLANFSKNRRAFKSLDMTYRGFRGFRGFSDFNGEFYLEKLYDQYPDAKFIFTVRSAKSWVRSRRVMFEHELNNTSLPGYKDSKLEDYNKRVNLVHNFFKDKPKEKFLEIGIIDGDGWEKLCAFLGKPIPDVSFPDRNWHIRNN